MIGRQVRRAWPCRREPNLRHRPTTTTARSPAPAELHLRQHCMHRPCWSTLSRAARAGRPGAGHLVCLRLFPAHILHATGQPPRPVSAVARSDRARACGAPGVRPGRTSLPLYYAALSLHASAHCRPSDIGIRGRGFLYTESGMAFRRCSRTAGGTAALRFSGWPIERSVSSS